MRDRSATDYYQYKWSVGLEKEASVKEKLLFVLVVGGLMGGSIYGSYWYNKRLGFASYEFFILMVVFAVSILGVLGYYWNKLLLRDRLNMRSYKISRDGVVIRGKKVEFDEINGAKTLKNLENQSDEDKLKRNVNNFLFIPIYGDFGNRQLEFADDKIRNKVSKALEVYLKN